MRRVLVIGSGIAGTAAALSAARAGARVSVVSSGPGASALAGGAIDLEPWESCGDRATPIGADERAVLDALGGFGVGDTGVVVATLAGILRPARGADLALLDLGPLRDAEVLVPDAELRNWDATALARAWNDSPAARERRLRFATSPVQIIQTRAEHDLGDADMAALHDAPDRIRWLAARLGEAKGTRAAVLLPPWLGVDRARAAALGDLVGVRCGEALGGTGGPSGLRFENARDRAFAGAGVESVRGRIVSVTFDGSWRGWLETGDALDEVDAVVLATGGLLGGGLLYSPIASVLASEPRAAGGPLVRATLDAPLVIGVGGAPLEPPSSLFGGAPETHAWPYVDPSLLERAGVLLGDPGHVRGAPTGLFAAGEVVADRPRTWLDALSSGVAAGSAAAR